jgi:hypothetical protein
MPPVAILELVRAHPPFEPLPPEAPGVAVEIANEDRVQLIVPEVGLDLPRPVATNVEVPHLLAAPEKRAVSNAPAARVGSLPRLS